MKNTAANPTENPTDNPGRPENKPDKKHGEPRMTKIDTGFLNRLGEAMNRHDLAEIKLETDELKLVLRRPAAFSKRTLIARGGGAFGPAPGHAGHAGAWEEAAYRGPGEATGGAHASIHAGHPIHPGYPARPGEIPRDAEKGPPGSGGRPGAEGQAPGHTTGQATAAEPPLEGEMVKSPIVGTAYLSSRPGAEPFISVGDKVTAEQTLLIVEAMKVMNNIGAPKSGTILKIFVADGQPVEYGQDLVLIDPS